MNLDRELVREAASLLETDGATETVHSALRDVVRRAHLRRLAEWDFSHMTLDDLEEMRKGRQDFLDGLRG